MPTDDSTQTPAPSKVNPPALVWPQPEPQDPPAPPPIRYAGKTPRLRPSQYTRLLELLRDGEPMYVACRVVGTSPATITLASRVNLHLRTLIAEARAEGKLARKHKHPTLVK